MEKKLRATKFELDGIEMQFDGFTFGDHWNGWAKPFFTVGTGHRIMEEWNAVDDPASVELERTAHYDEKQDAFMVWDSNVDEWSVYEGITLEGRRLYAIGAGDWCWDEYEPENA